MHANGFLFHGYAVYRSHLGIANPGRIGSTEAFLGFDPAE
jgi:hypothetical protein